MKKLFILLFLLPFILYSQNKTINSEIKKQRIEGVELQNELHKSFQGGATQIIIDVNNLKAAIKNNGIIFDADIWPRPNQFQESDIFFSGGFYLTGKNGNQWWANAVASSARTVDYLPGKVGSNPNDTLNVIYVVKSSDPHFGQSWQEWRKAVQLGAEFYDGDNDGIYNPVDKNSNGQWDTDEDKPNILGNYTAFFVYNDSQVDSLRRFRGMLPLGIEIHQTIFGVGNTQSPLDNTLFFRYRLINRGTVNSNFDSVYFMFWSDPDLGNYLDDLIGSDTLLNSVYVYNKAADSFYGSNPPAAAQTLLQTPVVYIPGVTFIDNNSNGIYDAGIDIALDTAKVHLGPLLGVRKYPGAKNQKVNTIWLVMKSNPWYINDPIVPNDVVLYAQGKTKEGIYLNPCTWEVGVVYGEPCNQINPLFVFSGNPVENTGWINTLASDYRMYVITGPFNLKLNEPVDIWGAFIVGRGTSNLNSISVMKQNVQFVIDYYKNNFVLNPTKVENNPHVVSDFKLYQNYPNPFNPKTKIRIQIPNDGLTILKVYDLLGREIKTIVNEELKAGEYEYEFDASQINSTFSSGMYFYQLKCGEFVQTKKMMILK